MIAHYRDLVWYLSEGIATFERSVTGAILDRLEAARYCHWLRCKLCKGSGEIDWPTWRRLEEREPCGDWEALRGQRCPDCGGDGGHDTTHAVPIAMAEQEVMTLLGSAYDSHESTVGDEVLVRYAQISRYLDRMPQDLRLVLTAAYEDERPRQGLTMRRADKLGLPPDHPLRNGLAEYAMHARRVDAVQGALRCERKMAAGYLWLAEAWWDRTCGKAVTW